MRWNPACLVSDTTYRFASAKHGRPRSTKKSSMDCTYSAVTMALAFRTSYTVSSRDAASSTPAVVTTVGNSHAFP